MYVLFILYGKGRHANCYAMWMKMFILFGLKSDINDINSCIITNCDNTVIVLATNNY